MRRLISKTRLYIIYTILLVLLFFGGVGCKTMRPVQFPSVSNIGAMIDGDTAYLVYTSVENQEDGWQIEQLVRSNHCKNLVVYLVNGGGSAPLMFDVCAVLTNLRNDGVHITTIGSGMIASAAVPIFVQGDVRILRKNCQVMLHPGGWQGHEDQLTKEQNDLLDEWEHAYARIMAERTKMTEEEVYEIMNTGNTDTGQIWYTAQEALDRGIATEIE